MCRKEEEKFLFFLFKFKIYNLVEPNDKMYMCRKWKMYLSKIPIFNYFYREYIKKIIKLQKKNGSINENHKKKNKFKNN